MNFSWNPNIYENHSQGQFDNALKALAGYNISKKIKVLDIGCGDGKITASIAKQLESSQVLGIDLSQNMINHALEIHATENLNFKVQSASNISYKNEFDLIVSFSALHWVHDQKNVVTNIGHALKKGGEARLVCYPQHPDLWQAVEEVSFSNTWQEYFTGYKNPHQNAYVEDYRDGAIQGGMEIAQLHCDLDEFCFETQQETEMFLYSWLPHTEKLPKELHNKYIEEITKLVAKKYGKKKVLPFYKLFLKSFKK
ncbi:hypothetical protein DA717_12815 [Piscirickettsiaceae bacterium NZ-RLO2]|uniref:class I SAM-dependent methyltransferase n=1 Tax=Piscirickettsia salmonis TaxID=1238 RepID=UPI000F08F59A|nr:hypothetical protein DA717_12815 [Piscirickettsiaceae bacterium NZ-RLO2]